MTHKATLEYIVECLEKFHEQPSTLMMPATSGGSSERKCNLSTLKDIMDEPNFRFVKLDICDREGVYALFEEEHPDIVVNFAAESHVDRSIEDPGVFLQTNIIGTSILMDACRKYGIKRYHQVFST